MSGLTWNLFRACSGLSLLLCGAGVVLWARSYQRGGEVEFVHRGVRWALQAERGQLTLHNRPQRAMEWAQMQEPLVAALAERRKIGEQLHELEGFWRRAGSWAPQENYVRVIQELRSSICDSGVSGRRGVAYDLHL